MSEDQARSPLAEIEASVQARAKDLVLDLGTAADRAALRQLVEAEISEWTSQYQRGLRTHDLSSPELVADRVLQNLVGHGPLATLLADDDVWEIMINGPDAIFVKRHVGVSGYHDEVFHDDEHVLRTLTKILDESTGSHRKLDPAEGLQDAQLDNGARLHIVHGDVGREGHVLVNIRKFTGVAIRSLEELVERDMLDPPAAELLRAAVRARQSIVFAGAPGSGKTTMLSCCAAELDPSLRVVIAEEVFEADLPLPNVASMQTRPARAERAAVDLRRLVSGFLRMAPDVAIVGEVRDREALPLLLTLSSGVKGYTTIHAGSARQALTRLRFVCQLADTSSELPMSALNSLVSEAIDMVVHCARVRGRPRVTEIVAVEDLQTGPEGTAFTVTELLSRPSVDAPLQWTGNLPLRCRRAFEEAGYDIRALLEAGVADPGVAATPARRPPAARRPRNRPVRAATSRSPNP